MFFPSAPGRYFFNRSLNGSGLPGLKFGNFRNPGKIFVTGGEVPKKIANRLNLEFFETARKISR